MTTEVEAAPTGQDIVIPTTGEVVPLDADNRKLAEAAAYMGDLKKELARVEAIVTAELARRMDLENLRTVKEQGFQLKVGPPERDWNLDQLAEVLDEFVEKGRITEGARDRVLPLVTPDPYRKLAKVELNKLLTGELPEVAKKQLKACSSPAKTVRKAKVTKTAEVVS